MKKTRTPSCNKPDMVIRRDPVLEDLLPAAKSSHPIARPVIEILKWGVRLEEDLLCARLAMLNKPITYLGEIF